MYPNNKITAIINAPSDKLYMPAYHPLFFYYLRKSMKHQQSSVNQYRSTGLRLPASDKTVFNQNCTSTRNTLAGAAAHSFIAFNAVSGVATRLINFSVGQIPCFI